MSEAGADPLGILSEAQARGWEALALAASHLDPSLVDVLRTIGFDREYVTARGSYIYDTAGRAHLDMHGGEGFSSLGHANPDVKAVLHAILDADLLDGVQIHYSVLAGMLAQELSAKLPAGLDATFFTNAGAEAIDSAMKFARAATGRPRLIACERGYHGVTLGPLSIVGDEFFKEGFEPLLPGCGLVPYGDLERLEAQLRRRDVAAFIVEPVQGQVVRLPPEGYLRAAQDLCRRYGTLFVVDEIQTGLGRTGRWFACEHWGLEPDIVTVGKALSGGYMPVAAMVTRREIFQRAVGTLERSYVHQSTYGRNRLAMAAGLASLRVIERDGLVARSAQLGARLMDGLDELRRRHELIGDVRGLGLILGIELKAPRSRKGQLAVRLMRMASEGLFPQLVVIPLHQQHGVITMAAGKNDVIKLLPPLTLSEAEADEFLSALDSVLTDCEQDAGKNWGVVRDIALTTLRGRDSSGRGPAGPQPGPAVTGGRPVDPDADNLCLLTGASGFIGGHLAARLVREGYQVRCLVRPTSDTAKLAGLGVELVYGDLTDPATLPRAVEGCRYVIHAGAMVSDWALPQEIQAVNVAGTRSLLAASAQAAVARFVHISSTDVYGHPGTPNVTEGHSAARFANWYAQTKLGAEEQVRRAAAAGMETVILRPATVYGPGCKETVLEVARAIRRRQMLLVGGGRALVGLCYVENLADATLLALSHERAAGEAFNIADGVDVSWRRFVDDLAAGLSAPRPRLNVPYPLAVGLAVGLEHGYRGLRRATGLKTRPLLSRQAVQLMGIDQSFSTARARELLGWEPRVDYQSGLGQTLEWLRAEGV
jgi:acetylornithine/succinyldiaminopimelate/putrescine aminotransferase/nucleoside-diphosphate-sugar epimerase